ncbi:MAG TPA: diguanylate cyclase [Pyrinomonadaceae bacterium]|nr:diguanylate cyclase [Pyrinomonadaceae bacterium]
MTARAETKNNAKAGDRSRGRVLLITDADQSDFVEALGGRGIDVVGVSHGAAALVSLQRSRPHLVVADVEARGLRMRELGKMLAQSDDGIPLVLVGSEPATLDARRAALFNGAFDYFEYPAEIELLIERTHQLVLLRQKIDQLRADADLDSLTGLANRRRFRVALAREVERWRRYRIPCALLMLDIDHLKQINDKFGHPAGDIVIRQIAQTLKEVSRDNDTAARLGGEEFGLLLAGVDLDRAAAAANRLRAVLSGKRVEGVGTVTVSIGVAGCPENATSERTLYASSDRALYVSKNSGRDRVSVAPPLQEKLPGV